MVETLGDRLKYLRRHLKLTQREFGQKIGMSMAIIQRWESDSNLPSEGSFTAIEEVFKLSPDWLRNGKGDMYTPENYDEPELIDIMLVDAVYLHRLKTGVLFLQKGMIPKYITVPKIFISADAEKIICSRVLLKENSCPYIKDDSYLYIDITHDLSHTDYDDSKTKEASYYLAARHPSKTILESIDKHLIIANAQELNEKDYIIGKVVGANLSL